jgi:methyltransferase-like protein/2-polyprenyl-3-methyl-5-hydroxy-6-metoxy-1,4-benzoquinol methylase
MNTPEDSAAAYDEVLYPPAVHVHTHIDRLATVGKLRGMHPTPIDHCRVMELGCGAGTNLISMAFNFPESKFEGIDIAHKPIKTGEKTIQELGLKNIQLHRFDLSQANKERFGSFDYIIAHGVYSWVPASVRERILAGCREMLDEHGIAYISYNAYPGNHLRDLARGIIRFHAAHFKNPTEKIRQARGILQFLAESTPEPDAYITALRAEFERACKYKDEAFYHDDLAEISQSFYFHEFIRDAERHGLQYLGEATPNEVDREKVTTEVLSKLKELEAGSEIIREQYKDFVLGCPFRRNLLCHQEVALAPRRLQRVVNELYVACEALPIQLEGKSDSTVFRRPAGSELESAYPLMVAALKCICSEWPCAIPVATALEKARASLDGTIELSSPEEDAAMLADGLLGAYERGFLQLQVGPRAIVNQISNHPMSSMLARFQLKEGDLATSQLHKLVRLEDPLTRQMVQLLDGSRDLESIASELLELIRSGQIDIHQKGERMSDPQSIATFVTHRVPEVLQALLREGLIIG